MFLFALLMPCQSMAQNVVFDTVQAKSYRIKAKRNPAEKKAQTQTAKPSEKKEKSFMGLMGSLGQGLLSKFKRRFNLEDIKDKVEITKQGIKETLKSKNKDQQSKQDPPPEETKNQ